MSGPGSIHHSHKSESRDGHHHGISGAHDQALRSASKRSLTAALALISCFMVAEVVGGLLSGSLALLADAGHMLTDSAAIALALLAMVLGARAYTAERTYGYERLEILAALVNVLVLWLIALAVIWEALQRLSEPPVIQAPIVVAVGSVGLAVNVAAALILHKSAKHSINVAGAFAHVLADLAGSLGVLIAGTLVWAFGWMIADPIVSLCVGVLILGSTWNLLYRVVNVLLEGAPEHVDIPELCARLQALDGVVFVHDIHAWTLSPGNDALTAHVLVDPDYQGDTDALLQQIRIIASRDFNIQHITIQIERSAENCTERHHFDHLSADVSRS